MEETIYCCNYSKYIRNNTKTQWMLKSNVFKSAILGFEILSVTTAIRTKNANAPNQASSHFEGDYQLHPSPLHRDTCNLLQARLQSLKRSLYKEIQKVLIVLNNYHVKRNYYTLL